MKKALIAVGVYAGIGALVELGFIVAVRRRFPAAEFPMSSVLLSVAAWPLTAYKIASGQTVLSIASGAEPSSPGAFGAIPRTAVNPAMPIANSGVVATGRGY